eukprot:TRINITY_DN3612_c0_g1_i1.p1 TRINITY_DN3612_c0_g1~~TRINITY_DN3612_c0_g1_i1.p1  ORF type:complete len:114 (-),score=42.82 TRINITY_DN3612_c0_g1_i1:144-449(-)
MWKELTPEEKKKYEDLSSKDSERYQEAIEKQKKMPGKRGPKCEKCRGAIAANKDGTFTCIDCYTVQSLINNEVNEVSFDDYPQRDSKTKENRQHKRETQKK